MSCRGLTRRQLVAGLGLLPCLALAGRRLARGEARVLVIGGGFAGAAAARLLKQVDPGLHVSLIEPRALIHTCPRSNHVITGLAQLDEIAWGFDELREMGVSHIRQAALDVDTPGRRVQLEDGHWLAYDWLILAPGIDFRFDAIDGYDAATAERVPHAWKAGPQSLLLRQQLKAMAPGGTLILSVPDNPYRCPPGPYERASLIAHYLSRHNPRAKLLILDAKASFSKQALFRQGWERLYPGMIEWLGHADDGRVVRLDAVRGELECEFGSRHRGEVINLIPPQRAGDIARRAGLTDASGWVPVEADGFRACLASRVMVIGDACLAAPMPKSAHSAHSQARRAVSALLAELGSDALGTTPLDNVCYSQLSPDSAISIAARYESVAGQLQEQTGSLRLSSLAAPEAEREREAAQALAWYQALGRATWGNPA
ncbi:FCSD flavin-binding domain-containing protein [Stutzerimonas tarimensis]|uniref:FCSD flavin-binding domain-containing protein n=1 Tax=Stutzerimonas tarimensis TaxID=1507735 RepID=A0ABV7T358_9GAMM